MCGCLMEFEKLQNMIAELLPEIPAEDIHLETRFIEDLGADSLELLQLAVKLEEVFHIPIEKEKLAEVVTVEDVLQLVGRRSE